MNTKQLENIIDFLESVYTEDRQLNTAVKHFIDVVAPWNYAPVVDGKLTYILRALKVTYPEITELLEYYFLEAKDMDWWWMIESNGKRYKYWSKEDIIQSMIDFWYII